MPKARRLSSEIVKALKEYEGFNDDDLTEALRTPSYEPASRSQP
ncbi:MAG: hypothetical protein RXQ79_05325 [Acidilobus sp.]